MSQPNKYVRSGAIRTVEVNGVKYTELYGRKMYAPGTPGMPSHLIGLPDEIVFFVAGDCYYPTTHGYERIISGHTPRRLGS